MKPKIPSSSRLITPLLILAILIFSVIALYASYTAFHREQKSIERYTHSQMKTLILDLETKMMSVEAAAISRSHTRHYSTKDSAVIYSTLEQMIADLKFVHNCGLDIYDITEEDSIFTSMYVKEKPGGGYEHQYFVTSDQTFSDEDEICFLRARFSGGPEWSQPYEDIFFGGDLVITCYTKVVDHPAMIGIDIEMSELLETIDSMQFFAGSKLYINVPSTNKCYTLENGSLACVDSTDINKKNYTTISARYRHLGLDIINVVPDEMIYDSMSDTILWGLLLFIVGLTVLAVVVHLSYKRAQEQLKQSIKQSHKAEMARKRLEDELAIAADIQQKMLNDPDKPVSYSLDGQPAVEIMAKLIPAREIGGDLYEYHLDGDRLYFCIGDVSGKGVPASLVMSMCSTLFHASISYVEGAKPSRILEFMNEQMCRRNEEIMFVTMWVGELNLRTGELSYASAGHNPPVLISCNETSFIEKKQGLPLGMFDDSKYVDLKMILKPDQALMLYTDGITEAEKSVGSGHKIELFGDDKLVEACSNADSFTPEILCRSLLKAVKEHSAGRSQSDDITLLCVSFGGHCAQLRSINDLQGLHNLASTCDPGSADNAALVLEEAAVNAFNHGKATFVCAEYRNGVYIMTNDGDEFDPTAYNPKATSELSIGGRGISLIHQICSEFTYERTSSGLNRLTMKPMAATR